MNWPLVKDFVSRNQVFCNQVPLEIRVTLAHIAVEVPKEGHLQGCDKNKFAQWPHVLSTTHLVDHADVHNSHDPEEKGSAGNRLVEFVPLALVSLIKFKERVLFVPD